MIQEKDSIQGDLKRQEFFKNYDEIRSLNADNFPAENILEKLTLLKTLSIENIFTSNITKDLTILKYLFEEENKTENKVTLLDFLIYRYILVKLFKDDLSIITLKNILSNSTEPNYDILSKIYFKLEDPSQFKIKYENIFDLVFSKNDNPALKTIKIAEYLIQRNINFSELIQKLLRVKLIEILDEIEPKTLRWKILFLKDNTVGAENIIEEYRKFTTSSL